MRKLLLSILVIVSFFSLLACSTQKDDFDDLGLAQVQNAKHLSDLVKVDSGFSLFGIFRAGSDMIEDADLAPENNEHSTTNVQVEGIDEGDIIKTDGNRIYYLRYNALTVIEINEDGSMTTLYDEAMDEDYWGHYSSLYITDNKLVVIGSFYKVDDEQSPSSREDIEIGRWWFPYYSSMSSVDIYDLETLEQIERYELSGNIIGSRLIGDQLYLINTYQNYYDEDDIRPLFVLNGTEHRPDYSEIKYLPDLPTRAFTIIANIDLSEANHFAYDIFLGVSTWGQIYVNENGIYLASNYYVETSTWRDRDDAVSSDWGTNGIIISYLFDENGRVVFGGSAKYKGVIINQFAMDEYEGIFRIVTRDGWGLSAINRLYTFERHYDEENRPTLKQLALLDEGLGKPEETVRSVRFNKDIVTVVTFEEIDPFYVIDLSDPTNPTILGELEIPGFSTYQHTWKDDTIIGIGYETDDNGWIIGLKLSVYDISDQENPVELGDNLILLNESRGWQYGEALHNHRAILVSKSHDFIGFSIQQSYWMDYGYEYHSDYLIFDIDLTREQPIQIATEISHYALFGDDENEYDWYYGFDVNRAVTINQYLYVLSNGAISRHDMEENFELVDAIQFDN